jgi:hypothetical protein
MVAKKVLGGQNPDGSQKDGFLKYEKNRPVGVYDLKKSAYQMFDSGSWVKEAEKKLGDLPEGFIPWRGLLQDPQKEDKLRAFFKNVKTGKTLGTQLAQNYLKESKAIGEKLVSEGVAHSPDDVNGVLLNGFFHIYGPINEYV